MTSLRKIAANRRNAQLSTGPKTKLGQLRSSQNAHRHGLSIPIVVEEAVTDEVNSLAIAMAGATDNPLLHDLARRAAEAHFEVLRVRTVKHQLLQHVNGDLDRAQNVATSAIPPDGADITRAAVDDPINWLLRLRRYERRTLSRRNAAIRELEDLRRNGRVIETDQRLAERSQKDE
jgi:hypothetical protein